MKLLKDIDVANKKVLVRVDFNVCLDERYLNLEDLQCLKEESYVLVKQINSYIAYLRNRKISSSN